MAELISECPADNCDVVLRDEFDEAMHMQAFHPEIIEQRLKEAGEWNEDRHRMGTLRQLSDTVVLKAKFRIDMLRQYVEWNANTIHQTYHLRTGLAEKGWRECNGAVCREARSILEETK